MITSAFMTCLYVVHSSSSVAIDALDPMSSVAETLVMLMLCYILIAKRKWLVPVCNT